MRMTSAIKDWEESLRDRGYQRLRQNSWWNPGSSPVFRVDLPKGLGNAGINQAGFLAKV